MATRKLQLNVTGFTDGLNTEASVLNVLPSEMMDGSVNVELLRNGAIRRRRGVDFIGTSDAGGLLQTLRVSTRAAETNMESPAGVFVKLTAPNGNIVERIIVDLNNEWHVFEATNGGLKNIDSPLQTISRTVGGVVHSDPAQKYVTCQYALAGDKLFFAGRHIHPGYFSVAADNSTLEVTYINILIRDPQAITTNDRVQNASKWYECIKDHTSSSSNEPGVGADWEEYWFQLDGAIAAGTPNWASSTSYETTFLNPYDKRTSVTASDTFPTTVESFAGRVWYAGDPKNPNDIYFSQVIIKDSDIEKFHQFADPFDTSDPDLVADDGGLATIQGAGLVKRLMRLGASLFIGTTTGIWQITGPNGIFKATDYSVFNVLRDGIDGPDNMVVVDKEFIVFGQDSIWRSTIQSSLSVLESGQATFNSISEDRVETLYSDIPKASKASAVAVYNPSERRVFYFHNKTRTSYDKSFNNNEQPGYFKDVLVVDTRFQDEIQASQRSQLDEKRTVKGAFFVYEFDDGALDEKPYLAYPFISKDVPAPTEAVVADNEVITDSTGESVVASAGEQAKNVVLFIALRRSTSGDVVTLEKAFATLSTTALRDWASSTLYSTRYTSKAVGGVQSMGDALHNKAATYIYLVFKKVESDILDADGFDLTPGGCLMGTAWNFSDTRKSKKYNGTRLNVVDSNGSEVTDANSVQVVVPDPKKQVYIPDRFTYAVAGDGDDGFSHTYYRARVRGRGNTLQVTFDSEYDKDFHLVGWSEQFYGKSD